MSEHMTPIPSRIYNAAVGGHVAGADQIIDDELGLEQHQINKQVISSSSYDPANFSGMGKVILPKNIQNVGGVDKNILIQDMFYKDEGGTRVPNINTVFVIKNDFEVYNNPETVSLTFSSSQLSTIQTEEKIELDAATAAYAENPTAENLLRKETAEQNYNNINQQDYYSWIAYTIPAQHYIKITGRTFLTNDSKNTELPTEANRNIIYAPDTEDLTIYLCCLAGQYNYDINNYINIPNNSVLFFDGGSINGTNIIRGNNTLLQGIPKVLSDFSGIFSNDYLDITWFGAKGDDDTDCATIFNKVFDICVVDKIDMYIPEGTFAFKAARFAPLGKHSYNAGEDTNRYLECNNVTIKGVYKKSIIKSYNNGDVINLAWLKNLNIKDLTVTSGYTPTGAETWGANLISLIDVENITIDGCYCHDSFWKWKNTDHGYYSDGGDGITIQGKLFHNVKVTNCEIYNCDRGLDVNIGRGDFTYNPKSGIYISNVLVTKCYLGLHYGHYDYQEDHPFDIQAGLSYLQMKCVNCFQSSTFAFPVGVKAYIQTVATETIEQRLLSGYGTSWYGDIPTTSIPKDVKSSQECSIIGAVNCNIEVNSSAKEINYGFTINPGGTRGTSNRYLFLSSIISLTLSENATVVPVKDQSSITDEAKFKYVTRSDFTGPIDKSVITLNNLLSLSEFDDSMMFYTATNNNVFIIDGKILTRKITASELDAYSFDNAHNVNGKLITQSGMWCARNKISSSEYYMAFGIVGGTDDNKQLRLGFSGYGDICRDSITSDYVNGDRSSQFAGGCFIPVRLISNISSIVGYIPVHKNITKGTIPPTLSAENSGFRFYHTEWKRWTTWDGTAWLDDNGFTFIANRGTVRPIGTAGGGRLVASRDVGFPFFDENINIWIYAKAISPSTGVVTWVDGAGNAVGTEYITKSGTLVSGNVPEFDGTDGAIKDSGKAATQIP